MRHVKEEIYRALRGHATNSPASPTLRLYQPDLKLRNLFNFHVSLNIFPFSSTYRNNLQVFPDLSLSDLHFSLLFVGKRKWKKKHSTNEILSFKGQVQYLIKWRGWPKTKNTWELTII